MPLPLFPDWWSANYQSLADQIQQPGFDAWLLFRYALQALGTSLPIWLADYLLGLGLLRLWGKTLPRPLHHAAALGLGMGLAGTGIFILGTLGRITYKGLLAFTAIQLLIGLALSWRSLRLPTWRWRYLLALPLLLVSLPDLMMPVLDYDSTMYHMASARHYKDHSKIAYHDGIRFNAQPHLTVMLYLRQWWLSGDANLTKLVNFEYLAILILLFAWLARRFHVPYGGWLAAGLVFGTPIFSYSARVEYADLGLATWLGLGFAVLVTKRIPLAALLLGFAAATKLQGHVAVGSVCLAWLITQRRDWVKQSAILGAGIVAPCFGWWFRSYRATGSPVYPFLTDSPDVKNLFEVSGRYGVGHDFLTFLKTPWNMIVVPAPVYADLFPFGPTCLILIAIGILALALRRSKIDRGTLIATLASLIFTALWFRSGQVMRYEACLLPIWAYLLLSSVRRLRIPTWAPALIFVPLLLWSCLMTNSLVRFGLPPPVTWADTQAALRNQLTYYRVSLTLSPTVGQEDRVYLWFCDEARFYFKGRLFGDWFGAFPYSFLRGREVPAMIEVLKSNGFAYIVADRERAAQFGVIYGGNFLQSGIAKPFVKIPNTETLYDDSRYVVLKLR